MFLLNNKPDVLFQALADMTRIRIIRLLTSSQDECCLCEFVDSLLEPEYKVSKHLKILKQAGLLSARKEGRWVYHRLIPKIPEIQPLYNAVASFSDIEGIFKRDLSNLKKISKMREDGRCQSGIKNRALTDKTKKVKKRAARPQKVPVKKSMRK